MSGKMAAKSAGIKRKREELMDWIEKLELNHEEQAFVAEGRKDCIDRGIVSTDINAIVLSRIFKLEKAQCEHIYGLLMGVSDEPVSKIKEPTNGHFLSSLGKRPKGIKIWNASNDTRFGMSERDRLLRKAIGTLRETIQSIMEGDGRVSLAELQIKISEKMPGYAISYNARSKKITLCDEAGSPLAATDALLLKLID